jgi:hypothetical protein
MQWVYLEISAFYMNVLVLLLILCQTRLPYLSKIVFMDRFRSHVRVRYYALRYSFSEKYDDRHFENNELSQNERNLVKKVRILDES